MHQITVYRVYYNAEDGGTKVDELFPEEFPCEPDEFDAAEGVTAVDMALEILNLKIYAEEASSYPDWQRSTWYSRNDQCYDVDGADVLETTAHLSGFDDTEALEVYKRFTSR